MLVPGALGRGPAGEELPVGQQDPYSKPAGAPDRRNHVTAVGVFVTSATLGGPGLGATKSDHVAVGQDQPVPASVRCGRDPYDGRVACAWCRAAATCETSLTKGKDATVAGRYEVPTVVGPTVIRSRRNAHYWAGQVARTYAQGRERAEEAGMTVREHPPVTRRRPVAIAPGGSQGAQGKRSAYGGPRELLGGAVGGHGAVRVSHPQAGIGGRSTYLSGCRNG